MSASEAEALEQELNALYYSISHDLAAPLRAINGFSLAVLEDCGPQLDEEGRTYLQRIRSAVEKMGAMIDGLLEISRMSRQPLEHGSVDLSLLARTILAERCASAPDRLVHVEIAEGITANGDAAQLRRLLTALLDNAWKFTRTRCEARIGLGVETISGEQVYVVRDNGVGFDRQYAGRLFAPFQRLHSPADFEGLGLGLATALRVVRRHNGRIWADASPGDGAEFHFTLACQPGPGGRHAE